MNCPHQGAALCHVGRLSGVETVVWWLCWELSLESVAGGGNLCIPFPGDVFPVLGMLQVAPRGYWASGVLLEARPRESDCAWIPATLPQLVCPQVQL